MDHLRALRNLWWFTVGFCIAWTVLMPTRAHAYPATGSAGTEYRHSNFSIYPASNNWFPTRDQACAERIDLLETWWYGNDLNRITSNVWSDALGYCVPNTGNPISYLNARAATIYTCPNGGTLSGTTCTCPVGYTDTGTGCDATPVTCNWPQTRDAATNTCKCPTAGSTLRSVSLGDGQVSADHGASGTRPNSGCFYGCGVTYNWPSVTIASKGSDGEYFTLIDRTRVIMSGATCTVGADAPTQPTPTPTPDPTPDRSCPQGFVWGEVNNVGGCYPGGTKTDGSGTATNTKTNPDGTTTTTTVNVTENTICTGAGACTTTTTTSTTITNRDAGGNVTGTTTDNKTETKPGDGTELGAFCAKNPKANICKGAGGDEKADSFGGSCPASFTCEGDAVTCAIAQEQHKRNCEFFTPYGAESRKTTAQTLVDDAFNGTGIGENFVPRGDSIQAGTLNTGERINAGSCPAPTQIATPLGSFTLDFTGLCPWFAFFGNIVLFSCLLIAAKITIGGIVGSA